MNRLRLIALPVLLLAGCSGSGPDTAMNDTSKTESAPQNRLSNETSPYLLQHADNPVEWYPWGEEAFAKARAENKPIFLSVGYSTCHWCHVMAHESFENPEIAKLMNENFVNIKVDREERPDVDQLYMTYVQATTGQGGWPMSVFLTPDLTPIFGGTYFPPTDRYGRPGFPTLLARVAEVWKEKPDEVSEQAAEVVKMLQQQASGGGVAEGALGVEVLDRGYRQLAGNYDPAEGGFSPAPKFPRPTNLYFMFREYNRRGAHTEEGRRASEMALHTLRAMEAGGMYDHLGGGFHRYSVDEYWHVPHFEKMLYDQAQLVLAYLEAFEITDEDQYAEVARDILNYVRRDMTAPGGGFYSAEDADSLIAHGQSEHAEGAFYVWTASQMEDVLGPEDAAVFGFAYGVGPDGNVRTGQSDPHGEFDGKNVLFRAKTDAEVAERFKMLEEEVAAVIGASRDKLFAARDKRPHPHLDDKVITSWNGLMIAAFARGYVVLNDPEDLSIGEGAANFIRETLYDPATGQLKRSYREGKVGGDAFADDYANLIWGLLELYEAGFDTKWLAWAIELQEGMDKRFWDTQAGGYFGSAAGDDSLLMRMKEDYDGAEPAATSVAALNLLRLAALTGNNAFAERGREAIASMGAQLERAPTSLPMMLAALDFSLAAPRQVVIAGDPTDEATRRDFDDMLHEVRHGFHPNRLILLADGGRNQAWLAERSAYLEMMAPFEAKPTAYVCEAFMCQLPVTDLKLLREQLAGKSVVRKEDEEEEKVQE